MFRTSSGRLAESQLDGPHLIEPVANRLSGALLDHLAVERRDLRGDGGLKL